MAGYVKDIFNIASSSTIIIHNRRSKIILPDLTLVNASLVKPLSQPEYQLCEILEALQGILSADTYDEV